MTPNNVRALIESAELRQLIARRWRVSLLLTATLFIVYYGFILLVALDKPRLATRLGEATTLGIVMGVSVIILSWVLTAAYVAWANVTYDPEVERLRDRLHR